MAALALLGPPAEYESCPFQKVFVQQAATYSTNHRDFADCVAELDEFQDLPGDEWKFKNIFLFNPLPNSIRRALVVEVKIRSS